MAVKKMQTFFFQKMQTFCQDEFVTDKVRSLDNNWQLIADPESCILAFLFLN